MNPLHYLTIEDTATLIRQREVSSLDLVTWHLQRIEKLDSRLHAFITLTPERALEAARQADAEIGADRYRGPLHGIPIAHKDLIHTHGVRTTAHSKLLGDWVPLSDATVVQRLKDAGAISLGKTTLHEFAIGSPGADEAFPAARNPWNTDHMPGSSSSGSAAGVAAGLFMGATGSDTGGSVRHPAAVCGIVGTKPTYGRVSSRGVIPLAPSMDHVGPLTRSVADSALMLQAMAGYDPADSYSANQAVPDFCRLIGTNIKGLRIGVLRRFIESIEHTSDILAAFAEVERTLQKLGATLEDVAPEGLEESHEAGSLIIVYEAFQYHKDDLARRPEMFGGNFRGRFAKAAQITRDEYEAALEKMNRLRASISAIFASGVAAMINPGRERPAQTMRELIAEPLGKRSLALRMFSATGNPALVLPMGFSAAGLPLGLQIAAPHFREDLLFQVAHAYEMASGWLQHHPAL
jgi:aspartyl-tRNA(Asn)/glutamyl-tRNA(Gln) amidotransferase subunit A